MELVDFIQLGQQTPPLRFLVIGGWAVAARGHSRYTFDVDFLVPRPEAKAWFERAARAGLELRHEARAFAQLVETGTGDILDLMIVDASTFDGLWQCSEPHQFGPSLARLPSLDHLLALKLHALKQGLPHRTGKDAEDVEMLIRRNGLDLNQPHYEALFLKYGTRDLYDTFVRILRHLR